jgi:membrane peptidoglycan carboxypeptidase
MTAEPSSPTERIAPGPRPQPPAPAGDPDPGGPGPRRRGRRRPWRRRVAGTLLVVGAVVVALILTGVGYELALPGVGDAPGRVAAIVGAHGGQVAPLPLPPKLAAAVVAVEDEHFYANVVVNVGDGAGRAALASLRRSGDPGGSTIAQQLAKQLYPHGPGVGGTLEEIGLGVKLSLAFSKPEILGMYLNVVYYGHGYWGDVAAARGYFATTPDRLTWAEASLLAGLPQAPSAYDPVEHLALARQRQRHVLDRLVATGVLTAAQADAAYRAPLPLQGAER